MKQKASFTECESGLDVIACARRIAHLPTHRERTEWLDSRVGSQFHDLIWSTFPSVMAAHLVEVRDVSLRRQLLESVPEGQTRDATEMLTRHLWRKRKRRG